MPEKEATARIKINKLLEAAGWRFFPEGNQPANICLEPSVTIKPTDLDSLGNDFEISRIPLMNFGVQQLQRVRQISHTLKGSFKFLEMFNLMGHFLFRG